MDTGTTKAEIIFEPAYVDPSRIIQPKEPGEITPIEPAEIPSTDVYVSMVKNPIIEGSRRLVLNIETNGLDPFTNRIITIGLQDPLKPNEMPTIIMLDDEAYMIKLLFTIIQDGDYNDLVGYGLSFDYRFILIKAMKYNIGCQEFYNCGLIDLMQAVAQGKFAFVYFPQKASSLSNVANYLWGFPKVFPDLQLLKYYAQGNMEKVREFAVDQIVRIFALYSLFYRIIYTKFDQDTLGTLSSPADLENSSTSPITSFSSGSESVSALSSGSPLPESNSLLTIPEVSDINVLSWKCDKCLAEWSEAQLNGSTICPICGAELKRI